MWGSRPFRPVLLLVVALVVAFAAFPVAAAEAIRTFSANIVLNADGSVHVIESIEVNAEGDKINHGIYRDIPTVLINDDGSKLHARLDVLAIRRNGEDEPWFSENITNGTRIYIGAKDVLLRPGIYRYTIEYTMTRMARRFADHDELYWNATGNFWDFPILAASATVTLPEGAVISDLQGYTGPLGSREQAVTIERLADNKAVFRATRAFRPYEGMTVSASFQKGILSQPTVAGNALDYLSDHRDEIVPAIAAFIVLLYNLFAWDAVGRDPKKGTIIPLFYPPKDFSPALTHYVYRMGWRRSGWLAFTAALVDLAVKGLVVLDKDVTKKNTVTSTGDSLEGLPDEEEALLRYFQSRGSVTIDKSTGRELASKKTEFLSAVQKPAKGFYFKNNIGHILVSVVLSLAALATLVLSGTLDPGWLFAAVFAGVFLGIPSIAVGSAWGRGGVSRLFGIAVLVFFAANALSVFMPVLGDVFKSGMLSDIAGSIPFAVIAVLSIVAINIVFAVLMRAPTVKGRKAMDEIAGFRMYLDTAEKQRLNFVSEPEMTVSRFETILPFAIALGVEKPWTERFENDLARNAVRGYRGTTYSPAWSSGYDFSSGSMSRDVAAMASGMSAAMIASQPSSSSGSGGGGGGGSGGGGGGGGGGGW